MSAMKFRFLLAAAAAVALAGQSVSHAAQLAAYEALRTVGKTKGDVMLASLVEMRGADGDPQPARWLILFRDPLARGGVRELVVGPSGITSERTPAQPGSTASTGAMAAASLNLDSTGAFAAADREAARQKIGFNSVSYQLVNKDGRPVWTVRLFDADGLEAGSMEISAKDGAIVTPLRRTPAAAVPPAAGAAASTPAPTPAPDGDLGERWVEGGGLVGHVGRWSERAWKDTSRTAAKVGDSVSAFFVGRPAPAKER
jgi:hypothetical protein